MYVCLIFSTWKAVGCFLLESLGYDSTMSCCDSKETVVSWNLAGRSVCGLKCCHLGVEVGNRVQFYQLEIEGVKVG